LLEKIEIKDRSGCPGQGRAGRWAPVADFLKAETTRRRFQVLLDIMIADVSPPDWKTAAYGTMP
jgi:hypothetical protein